MNAAIFRCEINYVNEFMNCKGNSPLIVYKQSSSKQRS